MEAISAIQNSKIDEKRKAGNGKEILKLHVQSSLDIPGFSGETKNARYIEGHGISRDPFSGAKFQSKSLNFYIFNAYG